MSNYLAIATVTAALADVVHTAMLDDGPGMVRDVRVVSGPPRAEDLPRSPQINIFLYQVTPNTALRNNDLPTRSADGTTRQRPQAALDLDYLISFHGDDNQLEPQRMLGKVVSVLHSQPLLTQQRIRSAIGATHGREGDYLIDSDLADQAERVKFSPLTLSLEELSKLWSILFQAPYALSVLYRASVVLIEIDERITKPLPVMSRAIEIKPGYVPPSIPVPIPTITMIKLDNAMNQNLLMIEGQHLDLMTGGKLEPDCVRLCFDHDVVKDVPSEKRRDNDISMVLPIGLYAGANSVRIEHHYRADKTQHIFESNLAAFVLHSQIELEKHDPKNSKLTIHFSPPVGKFQRVQLQLNEINPPREYYAQAYRFDAPADNGITNKQDEETDRIVFSIPGVKPGSYSVQVRVDGADSLPDGNDAPQVTIEP